MRLTKTADEFYDRRDDRTVRISENRDYQSFHIRLTAGQNTVSTYTGQVALILAANMLVRWCSWVEFGFPDAPLDSKLQVSGWKFLHQRIITETRQADPYGTFQFSVVPSEIVEYTLWFGNGIPEETADFFVSADDWTAYASRSSFTTPNSIENKVPIGSMFAACIGVADAFKVATHQLQETRVLNAKISVFDFQNQSK